MPNPLSAKTVELPKLLNLLSAKSVESLKLLDLLPVELSDLLKLDNGNLGMEIRRLDLRFSKTWKFD